jgi:hypothetical protein
MRNPFRALASHLKGLSFNQRLTLFFAALSTVAGASSLVVSVVALVMAANTQDIKAAIQTLSELAAQTKRQADNTSQQLGTLKEQVGEARAQTKAISLQTEAIKDTSVANIRAATAQQHMADVTAKAQTPAVDLSELRINGLNNEPNKSGWIPIRIFWRFRNTGGSALVVKKVVWGIIGGKSLPEAMPAGSEFSGQEIVVTPTINSAFAPAEDIQLLAPKEMLARAKSREANIYFYARFYYTDSLGAEHSRCFGRQFVWSDVMTEFAIPAGGAAYKCSE